MIHPTAIIGKNVTLGSNVEIGPYTVVDGNVKIGDNTKIDASCRITGNTTIGKNNTFFSFPLSLLYNMIDARNFPKLCWFYQMDTFHMQHR